MLLQFGKFGHLICIFKNFQERLTVTGAKQNVLVGVGLPFMGRRQEIRYGHQRQHILLHMRCIWHQYSKSVALKGLH